MKDVKNIESLAFELEDSTQELPTLKWKMRCNKDVCYPTVWNNSTAKDFSSSKVGSDTALSTDQTVKARPNAQNISTQYIIALLRTTCRTSLATLL